MSYACLSVLESSTLHHLVGTVWPPKHIIPQILGSGRLQAREDSNISLEASARQLSWNTPPELAFEVKRSTCVPVPLPNGLRLSVRRHERRERARGLHYKSIPSIWTLVEGLWEDADRA